MLKEGKSTAKTPKSFSRVDASAVSLIQPAQAYAKLFDRFGPQGWWPVTSSGATHARYRPGHSQPPTPREALEICFGAILTQNTAWSNVEKALRSLHAADAVDLDKIARMPSKRLEGLIRSSGFFVQKSIKLKTFARHLLAKNISLRQWLKGPLEELRQELLSIKGIGPETADSMLLYAGHRPVFVVDAYTRRIGERLGWLSPAMKYGDVQNYFTERIARSPKLYQEFHALLVALAKPHCRKNPLCANCPLQTYCPHGRNHHVS